MKQKDEISKISKQCMDSELVEVLIYIFHCYHQQYFEKLLYGTVISGIPNRIVNKS